MNLTNFQKLENHIFFLKKEYSLIGIKAEFEAEGSSHDDISLLRNITFKTNTKLIQTKDFGKIVIVIIITV